MGVDGAGVGKPDSALGNPRWVADITLSWQFGSLSCVRNGGRLALPALARAGATLTFAPHVNQKAPGRSDLHRVRTTSDRARATGFI